MKREFTEQERRWVELWKVNAVELPKIKKMELRKMTVDEGNRSAWALLTVNEWDYFSPQRLKSSGLVEQQRLFSRLWRK